MGPEAEREGTVQLGQEMAREITVYKYLIGASKEDGDQLSVVPGDSTRSNEH